MKQQAGFLMKKQFLSTLKKNKYFYLLVAISTIIAAIIIAGMDEKNITDLASGFFFFVAFLWIAAVIFTGTAFLNYGNSVRMTKRSIKDYALNAPESFLSYDDEKILYTTGSETMQYHWTDITGFLEHDNSLFLIINNKLLESVSFARTDIGDEHYDLLKSIAVARFS